MRKVIKTICLHAHPIVEMDIINCGYWPEGDLKWSIEIHNRERGFENLESSFYLDDEVAKELIEICTEYLRLNQEK